MVTNLMQCHQLESVDKGDITFVLCAGLTLVERWNTDNNLGSEISIEDQLLKGLKLSFDALFAPQTGYECALADDVIGQKLFVAGTLAHIIDFVVLPFSIVQLEAECFLFHFSVRPPVCAFQTINNTLTWNVF